MGSYKCAYCAGEFKSGWTDEEASAEFAENFQGFDIRNAALVCDDCYNKMHPKNHPMEVELARRAGQIGGRKSRRRKA